MEGAWDTPDIWFGSNNQDAGIPCVFQVSRPFQLLHTPVRFPPALEEGQQAELKAAVQEPPTTSGIGLANWNWKAVWQFVQERFGISLSRSSCLNCLHRLGFAFKRPKKRLLKADAEKRDAFVAEYASLKSQGNLKEISGARIWGQDILR